MNFSNSCLAEAYSQDDYTYDNHDLIAAAFLRAIETYDQKKGDFRTWVGIKRSGVVRKEQRLRRRVWYLEEVYAANDENCGRILDQEEACDYIDESDHSDEDFLTSPEAIFNSCLRKEQKKIIRGLLSSAEKQARIVILKRFYQGKKMAEIADELQITDSTVDRKEKKSLRLFKEELSKNKVVLDDLIP